MNKINVDIVEQRAIFDGKPDFSVCPAALITLLNFNSFGGTPEAMKMALNDPTIENAKAYKVTLRVDYEEIDFITSENEPPEW